MTTDIAPVTAAPPFKGYHLSVIQDAHAAVNQAIGAVTPQGSTPVSAEAIKDSLDFIRSAEHRLTESLTYDGPTDALHAMRETLPRLGRAITLLEGLHSGSPTGPGIAPLLDEFNGTMDLLEHTLASAGWD